MGSSIVMMWIAFSWFIFLRTAARVVDLPDPVGPVMSTMPLRSWAISLRWGGNPRSSIVGIRDGMTRSTIE